MKIVFVDSGPLAYDGSSLTNYYLGGTEGSLVYLAEELAKNNHDVTVINGTATATEFKNVKYLPREKYYTEEQWWKSHDPDIIVSLTGPFFSEFWKKWCPKSKLFIWVHLSSEQPATQDLQDPNKIKHVDMVVGVSDWHCENLKANHKIEKITYVKNAINDHFKNLFESAEDLRNVKKKPKACYTSAPYRGLEILAHSIPLYTKRLDFDIFSSMKLYQNDDSIDFEKIYLYCQSFSGVNYQGVIPQKDLAKEIKSSMFFTYPCTMEETFCLSLLEAMAAGCKPIVSNLGALESTGKGRARVVPFTGANREFMREFTDAVLSELVIYKKDPIAWSEQQFDQVLDINKNDTWDKRVMDWEKLFNEVKQS
jgi:glycosyltransferase involved in cell wall biosynthesis